ncbi:SSI family serine proteinase inhibitor [Streptomyces sp. TG1A-60]|uniref:SSI family serine proteinase inhibitor n=1 Tax=Streptomyces sp. TG1A-60 TaxID=3129111 RepID=UPI0030D03F76
MTHTIHAVRSGLLAALALLTVGASAPAGATSFNGDWLYVSVTRGDARSSDTRGTLLLCDPPQGHGQAVQACAELREAGGDITRIPHEDAVCTEIYAPVRVTARGQWNGRPVGYEQPFANGCVMAARTGAVFALSS